MLIKFLFVVTCAVYINVIGIYGCKFTKTCGDEEAIPKNLRPHFTSCLKEKLGVGTTWEYLVNYVIYDDWWYSATNDFFCKGKNSTCWIKQLRFLFKPSSKYLAPTESCILEYEKLVMQNATSNSTHTDNKTETCEAQDHPIYTPMVVNAFTPLYKCPPSEFTYMSCMTSAVLKQTRSARTSSKVKKVFPRYNFLDLSNFIMKHRSDCRILSILGTKSYVHRCGAVPPPKKPNQSPGAIIRTRRAISLKELLASSTGGKLNFRISSSGVAKILPSGSFTTNLIKSYKCFGLKLQSVMKQRTVLSSAASKCNNDEKKRKPANSRRLSIGFQVKEKEIKEPGQVGKCTNKDEWTPWYNRDHPRSGSGDLEYFTYIRNKHRRDVCFRPSAVQALVAETGRSYSSSGQTVRISPTLGLSCFNYAQRGRKCLDYKVRFCCPKF